MTWYYGIGRQVRSCRIPWLFINQSRRHIRSPLPLLSTSDLAGRASTVPCPNSTLAEEQSRSVVDHRLDSVDPTIILVTLAGFHRTLATEDMDHIWPLYSQLHHYNATRYLTRRNYRRLLLCTIRARPTQINLQRLLVIVDDVKSHGMKLRFSDYASLIRWVGGHTVPQLRRQHLVTALSIFEEIRTNNEDKKQGHTRLLAIYNPLIHIASHVLDMPTAQRLYQDMIAQDIEPDSYTYASLFHAMGKIGDVTSMERIVDQLGESKARNVITTTVSNIVLSGYTMNGRIPKATSLFNSLYDALQGKGDGPCADSESFRIYATLLLSQQRRDEAVQLLDCMRRYQFVPSTAMYNALFASFLSNDSSQISSGSPSNELDLIKKIYRSMQDANVSPDSDTLYTLVSALLDLGDTMYALETFMKLSNTSTATHLHGTEPLFGAVKDLCKTRPNRKHHRLPSKLEVNPELLSRLNTIVSEQQETPT